MTLEPKLQDVLGICQRDKLRKSIPGGESSCITVWVLGLFSAPPVLHVAAAAGEADDELGTGQSSEWFHAS